jgi:hypothetical protein
MTGETAKRCRELMKVKVTRVDKKYPYKGIEADTLVRRIRREREVM